MNRRPTIRRWAIAGIVAAWLASLPCGAAIHPSAFTEKAPEEIVVDFSARILEIDGDPEQPSKTRVLLVARVLEVRRSVTRLSPGDAILVDYTINHDSEQAERQELREKIRDGWAGPQLLVMPRPPAVGTQAVAYLEPAGGSSSSGKVLRPAAHQYSFPEMTVEETDKPSGSPPAPDPPVPD